MKLTRMDEADSSSPAPLPENGRNPVSTSRVVLILATGIVVGTLLGMVVTFRQPKIYEAQARVDAVEHQGHEKEITRFRAEMVTRVTDFENKWATSFDGAAKQVRDAVRMKSDEHGVEIRVRHFNPRDAQVIAEEVASTLDTPAHEKEWAAKGIRIGPVGPGDRAKLGDIAKLESLLERQAVEAGFEGTWGEILHGPGDHSVLVELAKNEDFARRLTMLKELAMEVGYYGPPGEPIPRLPAWKVSVGEMPMTPASPNVALWLNGFRALGLALAGLWIFALLRWKPATLRRQPRAPQPARPKQQVEADNKDAW